MILNPCEDDPSEYLKFIEGGVICPKEELGEDDFEWGKAAQSTMIYGLNRSRLVYARQELLLELKARIFTIQRLMIVHERLDLRYKKQKKIAALVEDIIEFEMRLLRRHCDEKQPFALMSRQIVGQFIEELK